MNRVDIRKLDLNLLKVFVVLFQEGSVTAAGERLGLAQSSISHALGRLRTAFDNPLFVRTSNGMRPTPLALELLPPITTTLDALQSVLDRAMPFDPAGSSRTFRLLMPDVVEFLLMPRLLRLIHRNGYPIKIVSNQHPLGTQQPLRTYRDVLEAGQADLAIAGLPETHRDFVQRQLYQDPQVCLMSRLNPLRKNLTMETYLAARHLVVDLPSVSDAVVRRVLGSRASRRNIVATAPNHLVAPFVLTGTDLIAILPQAIAETFAGPAELVVLPPPFKVPPVSVRIFWHRALHDDAGCQWLRNAMAELFPSRIVGHPAR